MNDDRPAFLVERPLPASNNFYRPVIIYMPARRLGASARWATILAVFAVSVLATGSGLALGYLTGMSSAPLSCPAPAPSSRKSNSKTRTA